LNFYPCGIRGVQRDRRRSRARAADMRLVRKAILLP
jgi:hypothetical protein